MNYPPYLRLRARDLRAARRLSIDELAQRFAVSRTTMYYWVRDLPLDRPRSTVGQRRGTRAMQAKYRRPREDAYPQGVAEFPALIAQPTFRDFVVLYIAEGYKRNRNRVSIVNSDPGVMVLSARWLRWLTTRELCFSIQYHADQDLEELRRFWSELLHFDGEELRLQRESNSGQLAHRTLAVPTWCAHDHRRGDPPARAAPGLDRSDDGGLAIRSLRRAGCGAAW